MGVVPAPAAGTAVMRPSSLEIASGVVTGAVGPHLEHIGGIERRNRPTDALAAIDNAIRSALQRPPCLVSFSGGVDSSFVLAAATRLARRESLPMPVPISWRFVGAPRTDESAWQDAVVAALSITERTVLRADDELDVIGPVAQRCLRRFGQLFPFNVHLHLPLIELATGGSLLTGVGGDQVLTGRRGTVRRRGRSALGSRAARRMRNARRPGNVLPWLLPDVARDVLAAHRAELRTEPHRLDLRIRWHERRRDLRMSCSSLSEVAVGNDVLLVNPLVDPTFTSMLGEAGGTGGRSDLLAQVAAGRLPPEAFVDRPKAGFREVFLNAPTRDFSSSWNGGGTDDDLVDAEALRACWSHWPIPSGTAGLVQQLWLASTLSVSRPLTTTRPTQECT